MSVLVIKARVSHLPESQIEAKILSEDTEITPYLAWRKISLRSEQIERIEQYDRDKCLVYTYDGDEFLVKEAHAQLKRKWEEVKKGEYDGGYYEDAEDEEDDDIDDEKS